MSIARPDINPDWSSLAGSDEQTLRGVLGPVMERLAHRKKQQQELKIANAFAAIEEAAKCSLPQSKHGKACSYALSNRARLGVFLSHGDVEIDNNLKTPCVRLPSGGRTGCIWATKTAERKSRCS